MPQSATNFALQALQRRLLSISELRTKLEQKGFDSSEIDQTISDLIQRNYLNDARLAEDRTQIGIDRNLGKREITRKLDMAGFDADLSERTIQSAYESTDERALAIDMLKKRAASLAKLPKPTAYRRAASLLQRRGHDEETIRHAIREVLGIEIE